MDQVLCDFGKTHFGSARLGDLRLTKRLVKVGDRLARRPQGSLPDKMTCPKELRGLYRLMNHKRVTHSAALAPHSARSRAVIAEQSEVVLIPHDTTEINLTSKRSLRGQLGQLGNGKGSRGFLCHNSSAITAQGKPLGLLHQILHLRPKRDPKETRVQRRDRPDRESRLWVRARAAIGDLPAHVFAVDLCDRGGDTFEFLDFEHAHGYRYVVRSQSNRVCQLRHASEGATIKLHDHLRSLPPRDSRPLEVLPVPAKGNQPAKPGRSTTVAVAWAAVTIPAPEPGQARGNHRQEPLQTWALRVWEEKPPEGVEAVEWLLLSNVAVKKKRHAWERVDCYEQRWPAMEEFHKAQKTGCNIEGPQFATTAAMKPMIAVLSVVAWLLMYLRWSCRDEQQAARPAVEMVPEQWVEEVHRRRRDGSRDYRSWTVRQFFMALAYLGGHQNRPSDGLPGWQTLWKGWMKLHDHLEFMTPHHDYTLW